MLRQAQLIALVELHGIDQCLTIFMPPLRYMLLFVAQALFRRAQLKALVGLHSTDEGLGGNLTADEISIITGALDLTSKTAWTAMTPLDKVGALVLGLSL